MSTIKPNPGSSAHQITIFTTRIKHLTECLKKNKKDFSAKRGLLGLVSKRHRMLKYMNRKDPEACQKLRQKLSLRK